MKKYGPIVGVVVLVVIALLIMWNTAPQKTTEEETLRYLDRTPYSGALICLERTDGTDDKDCVPGLRTTPEGRTYGLYLEGLIDEETAFETMGLFVTVTGASVPVSEHVDLGNLQPVRDWTLYGVDTIIEANSITEGV